MDRQKSKHWWMAGWPLMGLEEHYRQENDMGYPDNLDAIRSDYEAPPHVPRDRVVDLSWAMGSVPNDLVDPYEPFEWLNGKDIPRLLYTAPGRAGLAAVAGMSKGNWVVTHYEDIDRVYTDNEH